MFKGRFDDKRRGRHDSDLLPQQARREKGKNNSQVFGVYVESAFMGDEVAAIMAISLANGDGRPPDWQDFVGIICLLVINYTISFIEENNAGNVVAALIAGLAPKTKVLRDGKWSEQEASDLVP